MTDVSNVKPVDSLIDESVIQKFNTSRPYMLFWLVLHAAAVAVAGLAFFLVGLDEYGFNPNATRLFEGVSLCAGVTQLAHLSVTVFGLTGLLRDPGTTADVERALKRSAVFWTGSTIITVATCVLFVVVCVIVAVGP